MWQGVFSWLLYKAAYTVEKDLRSGGNTRKSEWVGNSERAEKGCKAHYQSPSLITNIP